MRELVLTTARTWRTGTISQDAKPHDKCRKCGGDIWFGQVQFKGKAEPAWVAYSESGHGGCGIMAMEKHNCSKHAPKTVTDNQASQKTTADVNNSNDRGPVL